MTTLRYDMPSTWRTHARQLGMSDAAYAQQVADRAAEQWNRPVDVTDGTAGKLATGEPPRGRRNATTARRQARVAATEPDGAHASTVPKTPAAPRTLG